ncbi:ankyrin repeat-containing domain protein [Roridomyces roridus]|uniref:Ankyrin repeat-containing domain protein n=1 Tax=Roridomyces roridus TaxID=1738132 RepID=A0AAD7FMV0_9AGAR|nr:ankyrin repeat-containing domain protein [Roridomyces roridus]
MKAKQSEIQKLRKEGTGRWFLESDRFIEWQDNPGSLWLRGPSGAGKSVLSSTVISKIVADKVLFQDSHPPGVAFFYFERANPHGRSVESALRRMVLQLSAQAPQPFRTLESKYKSSNGQTVPTYQELVLILQQLFREIGRTYIILDALDECNPSDFDQLLEFISTLRKWTDTPLHLMLTSQPRQALVENIVDMPLVQLEADVVQADIAFFLTSELGTKSNLKIWRPQTDHIVERIAEKSQGMFRLAACLLIELSRCQWEDELDETLDNLPEDLFGIYDRFLQAIRPKDMVYVEAILRWLLFSARGISLDELADAAAFDFSNSTRYNYKPSRRGGNERAILNWLDGLIVVNNFSRVQRVKLAHASVHDFLLSQHFVNKFNGDLTDKLSHSFIAKSCLDYLLYLGDHLEVFKLRGDALLGQHPLADYAPRFWCYHLLRSKDRTELYSTSMQLLDRESAAHKALAQLLPKMASPLALCCQEGYLEGVRGLLEKDPSCIQDPHALRVSSRAGHTEIVRLLLKLRFSDVKTDGELGAALDGACHNGNADIVQLLLQSGVDLKHGKYVRNALKLAAAGGHTDILRLLLRNGAGFEPRNMNGALVTAIQTANMEIVHLLLENGADVEEEQGSPLVAASEWGRVDIVRLLLGKYNLQNHLGAALEGAALYGHPETVPALLEHVKPENKRVLDTPLVAAASAAQPEIIHILLDAGADINFRTQTWGTALEVSSQYGYLEIVRLLLQRGADASLHGPEDSETALQLASGEGHTEIVRLLLEGGAGRSTQDTHDALIAAASGGRAGVLALLIEKGVNLEEDIADGVGSLEAASLHGQVKTIEFLLDKGARINFKSRLGAGGTPLIAAVSEGRVDVVDLLLEKGADVNLRTEAFGTALEVASQNGLLEVVRLLIQKGADPNLSSPQHYTALESAAGEGHIDVVQVLLDNGADVDLQSRPVVGALVTASWYGRTDIIRLLLEKGIDIGAQGTAALAAAEGNEQSEALEILRQHGCT